MASEELGHDDITSPNLGWRGVVRGANFERSRVECDEGCGAFEQPQTLDEYRAAEEHWKSHACSFGCSHGR